MIGAIASFLKSLFPFIVEALSVDDKLRGSDRKIRIFFLSLLVVSLLLGWLANVYLDHTRIVNDTEIKRRSDQIEQLTNTVSQLSQKILKKELKISNLQRRLDNKDNKVEQLRKEIRETAEICYEKQELITKLNENLIKCEFTGGGVESTNEFETKLENLLDGE